MSPPSVASVESLEPGVREALRREILFLADSKRVLGIRYSDWLLGAPSIETAIAASAMAQDEWGHARLLYAMLKDFGDDPVAIEHERPPSEYCCVGCLDRPFEDWADFVAGVVLVDGALAVVMEALASGAYEPAGARIPKMLAEEEFHRDLGVAWFRRIAGGTDRGRERLAKATRKFLGAGLRCVDPDDDASALLAREGLTLEGAGLRERYRARVGPLLEAFGPDLADWEAPGPDGWDAARRRGPGAPDDETVERARGDRNRALFVE